MKTKFTLTMLSVLLGTIFSVAQEPQTAPGNVPMTAPFAGATISDFGGKLSVQLPGHGLSTPSRGLVLPAETLISGALLNLVSNAIKYGAQGSEVAVHVSSRESEMEFSVRNTGPAIPASDLKQIFERFYRPSRSESIPGWGLGLSFVRRICHQHGGRVQVSSDQTSGTSFTFMLPRGVREASEVAP